MLTGSTNQTASLGSQLSAIAADVSLRDGVFIILTLMGLVIFLVAIWVFLYAKRKAMPRIMAFVQRTGMHLDFGLAPREEVYEKFGKDIGDIIIDERQIVFWRFGWIWAIPGAIFALVVYHLAKLLIAWWLI